MSSIIKSDSHDELAAVRTIAALPIAPPAPVVDVERERLKRRVAELDGVLRQRESEIAELGRDVERAYARGRIEGHEEGLADAQDRQDDRLRVLENAVRDAQTSLENQLKATESLAALLARDGLEVLFGDAAGRGEMVEAIIRTQIEELDKDLVLGVEVSAEDFADAGALPLLTQRLGLPAASLIRVEAPSGHCVMNLRLGRVDAGLDRQWGVLRALLAGMAHRTEAT